MRAKRIDRRAFGAGLLRAAAVCGLRGVGGSAVLSAASSLGSGCADGRRGELDDGDPALAPLVRDHAPVVVVGTGYGGAAVAKRLGEKGVTVLMLEMGRHWNAPGPDGKVFCSIQAPDGRAMWFRDKLDLGSLIPLDLDIS